MSDLQLGELIAAGARRDAAHVAVAPVVAAERLVPGTRIGFTHDGDTEHVGVRTKETIGVVDPFLRRVVEIGERFWMLLDPQSVKAIRHDWQHPAFERYESEQFLRQYAQTLGESYEELLRVAGAIVKGEPEEVFHRHSRYDGYEGLPTSTEFWRHYAFVTGVDVRHCNDYNIVEFCC